MFCQYCGSQLTPNVQFCSSCGQQQPAIAGGSPPPLPNVQAVGPVCNFVVPTGVKARTGHWISEGWQIVKQDIGVFMGMALLFVIITSSVPLVLQGPLMAGFHLAFIRKMVRGTVDIGDLFRGFNFFVPTLIASLAIHFLTAIGFLFCIIPGMVIAAMYMFTFLFIIDKKMDFWEAMKASHEVVRNDYFGFTLFLITCGLVTLLGVLCLVVGILVAIPVVIAAITVAYKEIVGFEPTTV
jgi:uncharacterized membrane protein